MRQKKWFISNLDDSQRKVIIEDIEKSIIVQGMAGSGKTNLAIHRALQAKGKGSYAIVIMTVALRRMIAYGMKAVGLDSERIAYEWSWINRGFDLEGDVFNTYKPSGEIDENIVYLVMVKMFVNLNSLSKSIKHHIQKAKDILVLISPIGLTIRITKLGIEERVGLKKFRWIMFSIFLIQDTTWCQVEHSTNR